MIIGALRNICCNSFFGNEPVRLACAVLLGCMVAGCEADTNPTDNIDIAILADVYRQYDDSDRKAIQRNLRAGGKYDSSIDGLWGASTEAALLDAYDELPEIAGVDITTRAQAARYLNYVMQDEARAVLAAEAGLDKSTWQLTQDHPIKVSKNKDHCETRVARYGRNGETADLTAYINSDVAGWKIRWDGWTGTSTDILYKVKFDGRIFWGNGSIRPDGDRAMISTFNTNNELFLSMMRSASETTIKISDDFEPFIFRSDRFFEISRALKQCYGEWKAEVEQRRQEFNRKFQDN